MAILANSSDVASAPVHPLDVVIASVGLVVKRAGARQRSPVFDPDSLLLLKQSTITFAPFFLGE